METNEEDYDSESDGSVSSDADETQIVLVTESQEGGNKVKLLRSSEFRSYKVLTAEEKLGLMKRSMEEVLCCYVLFL